MAESISTSSELNNTIRSPSPLLYQQSNFSPLSISRPQSSISNLTELGRDYSNFTTRSEADSEKEKKGIDSGYGLDLISKEVGIDRSSKDYSGLDRTRQETILEEINLESDYERQEFNDKSTKNDNEKYYQGSEQKNELTRMEFNSLENQNRKSSLAPTATPFIFAPKTPLIRRVTSPSILTSAIDASTKSVSRGVNSENVEADHGIIKKSQSSGDINKGGRWSFNSQGIILNSLHISPTSKPLSFFPPSSPIYSKEEKQENLPRSQPFFNRVQLNELEKSQPYEFDYWQTSPSIYLPSPHSPTARFTGLPSNTGFINNRESTRSTSFDSSTIGSAFFPTTIPVRRSIPSLPIGLGIDYEIPLVPIDKTLVAQQLKSYFDPSPVEISPNGFNFPTIPSNTVNYIDPLSSLPLNYQTDPDDLLYTSARQSFVLSSLSSLPSQIQSNDPQLLLSRTAMMSHFDLAMHSTNPLATLYGISIESAKILATDPIGSGISEEVLKLAGIKSGLNSSIYGSSMMGEGGPSSNNRKLGLYKTELCRNWEEKGSCRYGSRCQYAHGGHEIRDVSRHPKFKTEVCRTFWQSGSCGYGKRCCFIHTTIPGQNQTSSPPDSLAGIFNGFSFADLPDTPPFFDSSLTNSPNHHRRTSSSVTSGSTSKGFGPAVATYLISSSPTKDKFNLELNSGGLFGISFEENNSIGFGGIKNRGNSEVPPQFQEPMKSRLQRLSSSKTYSTPSTSSSSFSSVGINESSLFLPRIDSNSSISSSFSPIPNNKSSFTFSPLPELIPSTNPPLYSSTTSYQQQSSTQNRFPLQLTSSNWLGSNTSSTLDWNHPNEPNLSPKSSLEGLQSSSDYL